MPPKAASRKGKASDETSSPSFHTQAPDDQQSNVQHRAGAGRRACVAEEAVRAVLERSVEQAAEDAARFVEQRVAPTREKLLAAIREWARARGDRGAIDDAQARDLHAKLLVLDALHRKVLDLAINEVIAADHPLDPAERKELTTRVKQAVNAQPSTSNRLRHHIALDCLGRINSAMLEEVEQLIDKVREDRAQADRPKGVRLKLQRRTEIPSYIADHIRTELGRVTLEVVRNWFRAGSDEGKNGYLSERHGWKPSAECAGYSIWYDSPSNKIRWRDKNNRGDEITLKSFQRYVNGANKKN